MQNSNSEHKIRRVRRSEEERIAQERAQQFGLPYLDLSTTPIQYEALSVVSEATAREANLAVIRQNKKVLTVAVENPENSETKKVLEELEDAHRIDQIIVASKSSLKEVWKHYPKKGRSKRDITGSVELSEENLKQFSSRVETLDDVQEVLEEISTKEASAAFEVLLSAALALEATDIHIEPQRSKNVIRLKLDGVLYEVAETNDRLYNLLLSRIKLLSHLKLNVHDTPQNGRFSIQYSGQPVEVRVSILPSEYNEDIALRILDPKSLLSLEELGLRPDLKKRLIHHLKQPQGFILVTGPTGAGKTTTLYASINFLNSPDIKVITLEDPIEYHLQGITQTQVDPAEEYSFETGLKAILRQDPDIVLVGELRGIEAATAAIQAALAGRLVFSTLHTVDSAGTAPRLIDMGADPATVSSALSASIAQRLIRRLCEKCKAERKPNTEERAALQEALEALPEEAKAPTLNEDTTIFDPAEGCTACRGTGYTGRIGVFEIFSVDEKIKDKILANLPERKLREVARKEGMTTMRQDALVKVLQGITSFGEIDRVLGDLET